MKIGRTSEIMNIKYLFTDMDGTLLDSQKQMSTRVRQAVAEFIARGGSFSIATGRCPEATNPLIEGLEVNMPAVLLNGAAVYDFQEKKYLHKIHLSEKCIKTVVNDVLEISPRVCVEAFEEGPPDFLNRDCIMDHEVFEENIEFNYATLSNHPSYMKILLYGENSELRKIEKHFASQASPEFRYTFSSPYYLEILPVTATKGDALTWISKEIGFPLEDTAAIGDFNNDIEMLRCAGLSGAPQNAVPAVKAVADQIVPSNDEDGIAHFIESIWNKNL